MTLRIKNFWIFLMKMLPVLPGISKARTAMKAEVDGNPGEAVLTSGDAQAVAAQAKVTREQVNSQEQGRRFQSIIDSDSLK